MPIKELPDFNNMKQTIEFVKEVPKCEGQYLIKWRRQDNLYSASYEVINVQYIEPRFEYGVQWDGYLAIMEWRGRSVQKINMDCVDGIAKLSE